MVSKTTCQHKMVKSLGLCLVDLDSGFVQQLYECLSCGEKGQVPAMFHSDCVAGMKKYKDCIVMKSGRRI